MLVLRRSATGLSESQRHVGGAICINFSAFVDILGSISSCQITLFKDPARGEQALGKILEKCTVSSVNEKLEDDKTFRIASNASAVPIPPPTSRSQIPHKTVNLIY